MLHPHSQAIPANAWKQAYFVAVAAFTAALFSDSAAVFAGIVVIVSSAALYELYHLVSNPRNAIFARVLALSILLGYACGTLAYLIANRIWHAADIQYWSSEGLFSDQHYLSLALAMTLLASAALMLVGAVQKPVRFPTLPAQYSAPHERFVWAGALLTAICLTTGDLGYMGAAVSDAGKVSPLGIIANIIVPPLLPFACLSFVLQKNTGRRVALGAAMVVFAAALIVMGRRYLLYSLVLTFVALSLGGVRVTRTRSKMIFLSAVAVLIFYAGARSFMAVRLAESSSQRPEDLSGMIRESIPFIAGEDRSVLDEALTENMGTRPFILAYLAGLVQATRPGLPLFGAELSYSLQMIVPSSLMPSKGTALVSSPEELVHPQYGISVFDGSGSIIVSGYDDFGWLGALLYPIALCLLYSGFFLLACRFISNEFLRVFVWFTIAFGLFYVEQGLTEQLVMLRNLTIALFVGSLLVRLSFRERMPRPVLIAE